MVAAAPAARLLPTGQHAWRRFFGTGLTVTAVTACLMLPRGTSLAELWQGVVVGPLKHPGAFAFGPGWLPGSLMLAGMACGLVLFASRRPENRRLNLGIAWLKVGATLV